MLSLIFGLIALIINLVLSFWPIFLIIYLVKKGKQSSSKTQSNHTKRYKPIITESWSQTKTNYKQNNDLLDNEEFRQSQEARKAYLKEKYADKLNTKNDNNSYVQPEYNHNVNPATAFDIQPYDNRGIELNNNADDGLRSEFNFEPYALPDLSNKTNINTVTGSILDSAFDYKSEIDFGSSFEPSLVDVGFETGLNIESNPKTDKMHQNEETVTDAFLRDYGLEKKVYEWEE
jgi:hypothetical protein